MSPVPSLPNLRRMVAKSLSSGKEVSSDGSSQAFAPPTALAGVLPITRYWGQMKHNDANGYPVPPIPRYFKNFDWVIGFDWGWLDFDIKPRHIFVRPNHLPRLTRILGILGRRNFVDCELFIAGDDHRLSQLLDQVQILLPHFKTVFFEAIDIDFPGVEIFSMGFIEHYLRGLDSRVMTLMNSPAEKNSLVLAAWGKHWPQLDRKIEDRTAARVYVEASKKAQFKVLEGSQYWRELSVSKFALCPEGKGLQSPKIFEAILMGTVPVATPNPTSLKLVEKGVPMLIVDRWDQFDYINHNQVFASFSESLQGFRGLLKAHEKYWAFQRSVE